MRKPFAESIHLLDVVSKNNKAWYTIDAEIGEIRYLYDMSVEQWKWEEERNQEMSHLRTRIDLLTKNLWPSLRKSMLWDNKVDMRSRH